MCQQLRLSLLASEQPVLAFGRQVHQGGFAMRRILFARNQPVSEKPVDENLNMLPRNCPRSCHLWYGLRSVVIQAAQNPSTPCGGNALAVYFPGNGPQPMKERRNLIEQAKQRRRLACIHDNHVVIVTIVLSIMHYAVGCIRNVCSVTAPPSCQRENASLAMEARRGTRSNSEKRKTFETHFGRRRSQCGRSNM